MTLELTCGLLAAPYMSCTLEKSCSQEKLIIRYFVLKDHPLFSVASSLTIC